MALCVYYNISKNKNKDHPENHDRIIESVDYLKDYVLTENNIPIYDNNTVLNYLQNDLKIGNREYIANIILGQIYSTEYIAKIKETCESLSDNEIIDNDTYFSNLTFNEIIDNSIIVYNVCHEICKSNNPIKYAYCLIRPPSHHATINHYSGFCIINHTYLTAKYLHDKYKKKVLILDYDVHHGDGTQNLINNNIKDEVYFCSMHCYGNGFYPGTGDIDENNEKVLNIPLKKGQTDENYISAFDTLIKQYIKDVSPDIIVISNGLDAHKNDPFRVMKLTNNFYKYVTRYLKSLNKPLIYILEGGYKPAIISTVSEDILNILAE